MQHARARNMKVLAIATGFLLWSTSASFAQCMSGGSGQGMASAGTGMRSGPRMMGTSGMGTGSSGASMMNLQQAVQMAQMVQQMRSMQLERLRMMQAQRSQQAPRPGRNRRTANRQAANSQSNANIEQLATNTPLESQQNLKGNAETSPQTATGRASRNRRSGANRAN